MKAVNSIYGSFDKVAALFAKEEDVTKPPQCKWRKTTKSPRERVRKVLDLQKVRFETPRVGSTNYITSKSGR